MMNNIIKSIKSKPTKYVKLAIRVIVPTNAIPLLGMLTTISTETKAWEGYIIGWAINGVIIAVVGLIAVTIWAFKDDES